MEWLPDVDSFLVPLATLFFSADARIKPAANTASIHQGASAPPPPDDGGGLDCATAAGITGGELADGAGSRVGLAGFPIAASTAE